MILLPPPLLAPPTSRNPSTPFPANSARLQDLALSPSPWRSVAATEPAGRWEGSRELPGEPAVMLGGALAAGVLYVPCVWHLCPKIHDQAHYFYHIISPQQSQAPWSMSVLNSSLPDGRSMAHLAFGYNKSLLAQRGSRVKVPEIKPGCFYVMQNKNQEVRDTCCRQNINPPLERKRRINPETFSPAFGTKPVALISKQRSDLTEATRTQTGPAHSALTSRCLLSQFLALNLPDQLCHTGQAVSEPTKEKVIKEGTHPNF